MAELVNLRQARKRKARAEGERQAEQNRARFGRTKQQKSLDSTRAEKAARDLEAHRREPGDGD